MKFEKPLVRAKFIKRYKRFFADCILNGELITAHVANTGSLKPNLVENVECLLSRSENPDRKIPWSLEALKAPAGGWVGINTSVPNKLVKEIFELKNFKPWCQYAAFKPEVKINQETRLDGVFLNSGLEPQHFIEVKNVTLAFGDYSNNKGVAGFPDAVTARGLKHLIELVALVNKGYVAELVFVVQRTDCESFRPAKEFDPEYSESLKQSLEQGVIVTPLEFKVEESAIQWTGRVLPLIWD